jgi:hypothetical protein
MFHDIWTIADQQIEIESLHHRKSFLCRSLPFLIFLAFAKTSHSGGVDEDSGEKRVKIDEK